MKFMEPNNNDKLKMFYSISEVAEMFDVSESLLRYWEKVFPSIKPKKTARNIRQYTADDIEDVRIVHNLVKVRGMKLALAKDIIRKNHQGAKETTEVLDRLQRVRSELEAIKKELDMLD